MNYKDNRFTRKIIYVTLSTIFLLFIPLIAMQFSQEVAWSFGDFLIAGILLFGTGFSYVLISLRSKQVIYRIALGITLCSLLFLIWSNLAVGIIGSENNPLNLWYFGVALAGIMGMILSQFKPTGLAYTLFLMIIGISGIMFIALFRGMHTNSSSPLFEILGMNLLFIILFGVAGYLLLYTGRKSQKSMHKNAPYPK